MINGFKFMKLRIIKKLFYLLTVSLLLFPSVPTWAKDKQYYNNYRTRNSHPFLSLATSLLNPGYVASPYRYGYGVYQSPYNTGYYSNNPNNYYGSSSYSTQNSHPFLSLITGLASPYNAGALPQSGYGTSYISPQFVSPQTVIMGYIVPNTGTYYTSP